MKIGLLFFNSPPGPEGPDSDFFLSWVRNVEEYGFDSIWTPDHVAMPVSYTSRYPFQEYEEGEDFKPFPLSDVAFLDPIVLLSMAAALTTKVELCTGVIILPTRNAVILAKEAATLDRLSAGRLRLGVGLGWMREEIEATGTSWRRRGARTEEMVEAMRKLWTEDAPSHSGEFLEFEPLRMLPKPTRAEGVPIFLGGNSELGARRAGRLSDGFIVHPPTPEGDPLIAVMREAAREAGRGPDQIEVIGALLEPDIGRLLDMQAAGYTHVYLASAVGPTKDVALAEMERIHDLIEPVGAELRGLSGTAQ
jgi:probable F420-dependent oxidoreductase